MNTAILFDTMSIQSYVFGSNKLKDNLGASYIIEHIYDYFTDNQSVEVGYIGGGNALYFTNSETEAKGLIKDFTEYLIYQFPGVTLAVAIKSDFDHNSYVSEIKKLFELLAQNKGKHLPVNIISSHGITDICRYSSLSVEYIDERNELISSVTKTKRNYIEKIELESDNLLVEAGLQTEYKFTNEIDKLRMKKGEDSHVAIVHIDGNGFGEIFRNLPSVEDTREMSIRVKSVVKDSFIKVLQEYHNLKDKFSSILQPVEPNDEEILPIRPIILGGDDVTFVCHGKLGIWFAEQYMEYFSAYFSDTDKPVSTCAGVVVVKAKFPFYRAYELAEELCLSAKRARKRSGLSVGGNWIDFQLAYSGLGNSLEEIRNMQYDVFGFNRPYSTDKRATANSFSELKRQTNLLKSTLPNSKIKDLRENLSVKNIVPDFMEQLKCQHPDFKSSFFAQNNFSIDPFFDMIELLELYPNNLLNE